MELNTSFVFPTAADKLGSSARQQDFSAPPLTSNENIDPTKTPTRMTKADLDARDRNAVAYTKAELQEGDTLVIIEYSTNCEVFDSTGFKTRGGSFRVHSEKLLATGSKVFEELYSEAEQAKFRRKPVFRRCLPNGTKYILNLTPPDEGEPMWHLLANLSCSPGIRAWFTAEQRCNVPGDLVGGRDEVARPSEPKPVDKQFDNLEDVFAAKISEPQQPHIRHHSAHWDPDHRREFEGASSTSNTSGNHSCPIQGIKASTLEEREDRELQEAIQRSKAELFNPAVASKQDGHTSINDVRDYCPTRHRIGIEMLLQLIEGKDPRFDSAPKIWTLFVLSKYFDCTKVVVDTIASWVLAEPNCQFIEILPEETLKMGLGLRAPSLYRPAFAILVSEHALKAVSRDCGGSRAGKVKKTNEFGRVCEEIPDDERGFIESAAYEFSNRIQTTYKNLVLADMDWFDSLSEYKKLTGFMEWVRSNNAMEKPEMKLFTDAVAKLDRGLADFIRGIILWRLNKQLSQTAEAEANNHRRAESYLIDYNASFNETVYKSMAEKEKLLTAFPWKALLNHQLFTAADSNSLFDEFGVSEWDKSLNKHLVAFHHVEHVSRGTLQKAVDAFNGSILLTIKQYNYKGGILPQECFRPQYPWSPSTNDLAREGENGSSSSSPQPGTQGLRRWQHDEDDDVSASTRGVYSLPMRPFPTGALPPLPQDVEKFPLLAKRPYPGDSSMSSNHIRNHSDSGTETTGAGQYMEDPFLSGDSNVGPTGASLLYSDPRAAAVTAHNHGCPSNRGPNPAFGSTVPNFVPNIAQSTKPEIPGDSAIHEHLPFFSLRTFCDQVTSHVHAVARSLLKKGDGLEFTELTDTLLCFNDEDWEILPLWAGGSNDESGGAYTRPVPPAPEGAGPSGPGPSYHTGYSIHSNASSEMDFDGASTIGGSVNTSVEVENGYPDYIDRRKVFAESEDDFHSEAFSDDTEKYDDKFEDDAESYVRKGKGKAVDHCANADAAHDAVHGSSIPAADAVEDDADAKDDDEEVEWDEDNDEEPFDFGEEPENDDA